MKKFFTKSVTLLALLLTLGIGNVWASNTYTFYCVPKAMWGNDWDNDDRIKIYWYHKGETSGVDEGTSTGKYYEGNLIYSFSITVPYDGVHYFQFQRFNSGNTYEDKYDIHTSDDTQWYSQSNFAGKLFKGDWSGSTPLWKTYGRDITFYAVPESLDGSLWNEGSHALYADIKYGDSDWKKVQMTKTAYTYNENPIYTCTTLIPYNVIKQIKFYYNDGEDHDLYNCNPASQYGTDDIDGKIFLGWDGSSHKWVTYGRDVTVYTIPDYLFKDKGTPYNESSHYPAVCIQMGTGSTWNTANMTKTSYTYDTYPIYKATILIDQNKFWEFQIKYFNKVGDSQVDLYQFNNYEPKTEYAPSYIDDKLYHGWNGESHDFFDYTYDVTLDQQSGSGGTSTIKATDGAAMPAATMPGRDGYAFGGYYTETDGAGTQYYDEDGESARNWNSRTITTLYAKWTAREYTITLENMPGTTSTTVTFDAALTAVTPPTKTYYTFDGYWTDNDDSGATLVDQLIDGNGNWKKDISPYTDHDGSGNPTWIYPNDKSLFAKWDEDLHDVTVAVSPAGAGSVQISGDDITSLTNIGYATHSAEMTAVPTNAAWVFKEWQVSSNAHLDLENYTTTGATMKITATGEDQTLTAVFQKRYELVGSVYDGSSTGGMPGWEYDGTGEFTINSFTAVDTDNGVDFSYSCMLTSNTAYKLRINDRGASKVYGKNDPTYDYYTLPANTSAELSDYGDGSEDVWIQTGDASGLFTFRITKMRDAGEGNRYYPTLSVDRPQQVNFGWKYINIGGSLTAGNVGGTVSVAKKVGGDAVSNGTWLTYGTVVTYTATPTSGYTVNWFNNSEYTGDSFSSSYSYDHDGTSTGNGYAKFIENETSVTLANDGHGKVQIGGEDATSTTCGVTTTRELTAVPNPGYKFSSWSKTSGDDITISSTSTNPTTLTGLGSGLDEGQTVTANFTERYSIKGTMNGENWGTTHTLTNIGTNASSKDTCYVTMTLPANTTYEFAIYDEQTGGWLKNSTTEVFNMTYTNHTNWGFGTDKTVNCGITTAGKGTYKFIFNITDKTVTVIYPNSYQVNYGTSPSVGGSVTAVDGDDNAVPNGGYVVAGGSVTYTAAANSGYTFEGWYTDGTYGTRFGTESSWTDSEVAKTSNSYAKFKSTNFVIYRTGDMSSDPRAAYDDVESYDGGDIDEVIEFRMKVGVLDQWYSLCLPFSVDSVCVWDTDDSKYYKIIPYWRTGGKYYTGHYIIRTPESATDFALANFNNWNDPESSTGYVPSKNTPYIIQWHDDYFQDLYISFFGATGQTIPSFSAGSAPSSDNVVNVCYNNSMASGSVAGVYLLDPEYGAGAWLRDNDASKSRTINPFECYIRANSATTTKFKVLKRDMTITDTPTDVDPVTDNRSPLTVTKKLIDGRIYILRGGRVYSADGQLVK